MAGGGGYEDPLEGDPALVLEDVLEEKVTRRHAVDAYGVVIADGQEPSVDTSATVELRAQRRQRTDRANADCAGDRRG
jgi:N-methylhydantoinase B